MLIIPGCFLSFWQPPRFKYEFIISKALFHGDVDNNLQQNAGLVLGGSSQLLVVSG